MHKILAVALAGLLLQTSHAWSQTPQTLEPIIVTATKLETPAREVASSVTVITKEEIQLKQQATVTEVLRSVPGLDVSRSGGLGQLTSVFLRGANSEHTLVLIDGVKANDPSSPNRLFDFAHLLTNNIERIEIVRGPASTLYGSDALGGVIQIFTKKGAGKPQVQVAAEGGSYETHKEQFSISGGSELHNYSLMASYLESDGISSAAKSYGNRERDGYENIAVSGQIGLTPTENFDFDLIFRFNDAESDLDLGGGPSADDPNYVGKSESSFLRLQTRFALFNDLWEQKIGFSFSDYDRTFQNKPDAINPLAFDDSQFEGQTYKVDWQNNFYIKNNTITLGIDYEKEKADNKAFLQGVDPVAGFFTYTSETNNEEAHTLAYYLQDHINISDALFTTIGLRLDDHSDFASKVTYQIAASYLVEKTKTKIKASHGTGYKAPSLVQRLENATYSSVNFGTLDTLGNPDLKPEENRSWDFGVEQTLLNDRIKLSTTYFENKFNNLIKNSYNPAGYATYDNVKDAKTKGIEIGASWQPIANFILSASYTYTDVEDAKDFLRIPRNKFSANANYQFMQKGNINIDVICVGEREDDPYNLETGDYDRVELDKYTLLNLAVSFNVTEKLRLFARAENILDEDYEEVWGFGTPGISGYIGGEYTF
ncbi:hypothetical protein A7E78_11415 [Syntrophotalea acetylenivorans]|uniref:TonB-dependent receptor n=1 Tax=Syntrophotalea acetylenivorans TaxID=1842532 RepID=A0A1L3GR34_9BACT|nr:TonB-dependent receptor [Syntrophotalea acetylenivorans]APG28402.1 hypothetical protein A7E78_11415 [Syntrophotalea acetylenivorans]